MHEIKNETTGEWRSLDPEGGCAHKAYGGADPGAMVVEFLNTVVVDAAVVGSGWLIKVACVVIPGTENIINVCQLMSMV